MPIVVDHTPSGLTAVIASGLAAAENQRRRELSDKQALETRRLDIAQQGQDLNARQFEAQQADIPLARAHAADMVNLQYDRLAERDQAQSELRMQELQQREDAKLSPMQQTQLRKLDEYESLVNTNPSLAPVAKQSMLAQIAERRQTVRSQKGGSRPSPFPAGRDIGDTWEDSSGAVFSRDKDGNVKLLVRPDQRKGLAEDKADPAEFRKRYDATFNRLATPNEDGTRKAPTRQDVLAAMREQDAAFAEYTRHPGAPAADQSATDVAIPSAAPAPQEQAAQVRTIAGRLNQQMEMQRLVPPDHWIGKVDPNKTFPGVDGHDYTAEELVQVALQQKIPLDELIKIAIKKPDAKPTAKSTPAPTAKPDVSATPTLAPTPPSYYKRFNPRE